MKPQNFCNCGGPWHLWHLVFFTKHLKLVNSITEKYAESLSSIPVNFAPEKCFIFILDDYSAHLAPEVEAF